MIAYTTAAVDWVLAVPMLVLAAVVLYGVLTEQGRQ